VFRWLALLVLAGTVGVSGYYRRRARAASGTIPRSREPLPLIAGRMVVALPLFGGILAYILNPRWMAWASYDAPPWLRWLGVALGLGAMLSARWVLRAIGSNVSETILTKAAHELVTHGPYRRIRHPLYTTGVALFLSLGLIAANWFILAFALIALVSIRFVVVPMEERELVAKFGAAYEQYRRRTGAMSPRLRPGTPPGVAVGGAVVALGGGVLAAIGGAGVEPLKPAGLSSPQFESHAALIARTIGHASGGTIRQANHRSFP
jgi:protein-S-isoprenylcysteine O-methyltransferase Ste14